MKKHLFLFLITLSINAIAQCQNTFDSESKSTTNQMIDSTIFHIYGIKPNGTAINNYFMRFNAQLPEFPLFFNNKDSIVLYYPQVSPLEICIDVWKMDDLINGVSTKDVIAIQKHILGIKKLDSPYKLLAADINDDGKITAADLSLARKISMGIISKINRGPWFFINKNFIFTNPENPWFDKNQWKKLDCFLWKDNQPVNYYFIGVKLGDVDENAIP